MVSDWFERARMKTVENTETGCWEYQGEIVHNGYGRIWSDGRNVKVHRLSFLKFKGGIPDNLMVCHHCDVRNCWNPDHLFLGSAKDNSDDKVSKGRAVALRCEDAPSAKLSKEQVAQIRRLQAFGKVNARQIAVSFGVSPGAIHHVLNGSTWVGVGGT